MAELKANNQKPNFDNNPKLIEAIAEMRKNFCAETQNKVINTALACTFLVPAMVEKTTELLPTLKTMLISRTRARLSSFFSTTTKQTAHFSLFSLPQRKLRSSSMTSLSRALQ